jgi:mRNA interferase RelE/StbE
MYGKGSTIGGGPSVAYRISFKKSVSRDLRKLGKVEADRVLTKRASELPEKADLCMELKGRFAGLRKLRVGDYRVLFAIIADTVLVTRIGHRRSVYKA